MYYGQFFGKIVHEILSLSIKYGQSRKKLFCPWTVDVHGQLSTKRTRPKINHDLDFLHGTQADLLLGNSSSQVKVMTLNFLLYNQKGIPQKPESV